MDFEEQENTIPPAQESSPGKAAESGEGGVPAVPGAALPTPDEATGETQALAGGDQEEDTAELAQVSADGGEPPEYNPPADVSSGRKWSPWIIGGVILAGIVLVVLLISNGSFGDQQATPTAAATVVQPYIQIDQPVSGALLDTGGQVLVSGIGRGLFEGNVVVQAQDAAGNILAEQPATIQSPDAGTGGEGPWQVLLSIQAVPGTPGQIVAFSPSPVDGSNMAEARVDVTFGEPVEAYILISQPASGAMLDIANPVTVSGTGGALFEGNVVVQARDASGNVLAEQPTTIQSPDAGTGGEGPWEVQLSIQTQPGTTGQIVAFSSSPVDGSIMASTQVEVTFGEPVQAFIQINQPAEGSVLDIASPVTISGAGGGLYEGNVVVQARDAAGNVLAEQPTTLQSPNAGTGGEGPWEVQLSISAEPGSSGQIVAFSPSPTDGSSMASALVNVTYGQQEEPQVRVGLEDHLWLLVSMAGQAVIPGSQITADFNNGQVAGISGCNNYTAPYEMNDANLTIGEAATTRMACAEPQGVMEQETQYLSLLGSVASFRIEGSQMSLLDGGGQVVLVYEAAVTGLVNSQAATPLPAGAIATVTLADVSRADAPAVTIAEQVISNPEAFPFPFTVIYNLEVIDPRFTYAIGVRITDSTGALVFINTFSYPVITRDNPSTVEVLVEPVQ